MPRSLLGAVIGIAVAAGVACFETAAVVATQLPLNPVLCFLSAPALPDIFCFIVTLSFIISTMLI